MDPESKLSNLLPKLGNMVDGMNSGSGLGGIGGLGMMLDPSAKEELDDIKADVKTSEMIFPGLDEALAFDELLKHVEDPNWDVIVFDTAPTGHTLRFLSLPEIIEAWSGRLIRLMRVSGGIRSMLFGRKESEEMKQELERFRNRVLHVRRVLSDPELTSFTLVTIPEKMGVNETIRAYDSLVEYQLPISSCIVNRVTPEFDHPFLKKRRDAELNRIIELKQLLSKVEVCSMELLDHEVVGIDNLRLVANNLYGVVNRVDETLGPHEIGNLVKHSIHRGLYRVFTDDFESIYLHFPGIKRDELSLRSDDGILYIGLNGREREIETSIPVKASQVEAKLEGDVLRLNIPLNKG